MSLPTFTCDSCRTRVGLHASRCPSCGKTFDAVLCPRCGHQGPPAAFADGCPRCRHLASPHRPAAPVKPRRPVFGPAMAVLLVLLALATALAWALRGG